MIYYSLYYHDYNNYYLLKKKKKIILKFIKFYTYNYIFYNIKINSTININHI